MTCTGGSDNGNAKEEVAAMREAAVDAVAMVGLR